MAIFSRFKGGSGETTPRNSYEAPPNHESKKSPAAGDVDTEKKMSMSYLQLFFRFRTISMVLIVYAVLHRPAEFLTDGT